MSLELWIGISLGGIITIAVGYFFYKKSPSKEDIKRLEDTEIKSKESIITFVQEKSEDIQEKNLLTANIQLDNLINSQFNRYLETKNIDKELIFKELEGNIIKTLYIIKQQEAAVGEKKLLAERIKILGFKRVAYGDYILPPKKMINNHFLREKDGVKKWVQKNLLHGIVEHDFVNSVVIVDLSNMYDEQKGNPKKAKKILGGVLKPADFISKTKLLSDIHKKDNISLKEIIQIPFIDILINQEHPEIAEKIKKINTELVESVAKKLNVQRIVITDLSKLNEEEMESILAKHKINNTKTISKEILGNVAILTRYFNKDRELFDELESTIKKAKKEV